VVGVLVFVFVVSVGKWKIGMRKWLIGKWNEKRGSVGPLIVVLKK